MRTFYRLGGKIIVDISDWTENTTHVVLETETPPINDNRKRQTRNILAISSNRHDKAVQSYSCVPNLKYFFGVVNGIWIVSSQCEFTLLSEFRLLISSCQCPLTFWASFTAYLFSIPEIFSFVRLNFRILCRFSVLVNMCACVFVC